MKSSALHNTYGLYAVLIAMFGLSVIPVIADEIGEEGVLIETDEEEPNPFDEAVTTIDGVIFEAGPAGGSDEKAQRDAFLALLDEGTAYARNGSSVDAINSYISAVEEGYGSAAPYYNIAVLAEYDEEGARYKGKNLNYGLVFYDRTLAVDDSYHPARYNRGVLYHKLEMFEEAEASYRELLDTGGDTEKNARYNLALLLRDKLRLNEAISVLEEAEEPYDNAESLLLLALLNEESGAPSRAIRLYKKALEMDLSYEMNALAINKISTLRGY